MEKDTAITIQLTQDRAHEYTNDAAFQETFIEKYEGNTVVLYLKKDNIPYTGKLIIRYPNGNIYKEGNYKNGMENGKLETFYEDGVKASTGTFVNGVLVGVAKSFYRNGNLFMEQKISERSGQLEFWRCTYYENGAKQEEGNINGINQKTGHWIEYDEKGRKRAEGEWGMGGRHGDLNIKKGEWKIYDEEGNLIEVQEYHPNLGTLVSTKKIKE